MRIRMIINQPVPIDDDDRQRSYVRYMTCNGSYASRYQ